MNALNRQQKILITIVKLELARAYMTKTWALWILITLLIR